jgi:hypothetical protein
MIFSKLNVLMPSLQLCIFYVVLCSIFVFFVITNYEKLSIYFVLHFRSNNGQKKEEIVLVRPNMRLRRKNI